MSTITRPPQEKPAASEFRLRFADVAFATYADLCRQSTVRMAYDGKDLEIMVTGPMHEDYGWLLDRLITVVAGVAGIRYRPLGKTTWIRPELERGLEADQCYVFDPAKLAAVRALRHPKVNDVAGYPNPDLAVEVDISRPQVDRPAIYAAFQVPELWTFDGSVATIAELSGGRYADTGRSRWIPITAADATRWLVAEDTNDLAAWEDRLRAWAETLRERGDS